MVNTYETNRRLIPFEYLDNVDTVSFDAKTLLNFLCGAKLLAIGSEAVVFHIDSLSQISGEHNTDNQQPTDFKNVIRVPFFSVLGQQAILALLKHHLSQTELPLLKEAIEFITDLSDHKYKVYARYQQFRVAQRVAFSNATFEAVPELTIPINVVIKVDGQLCATFEKKIRGRKPFYAEFLKLRELVAAVGVEHAEGNIFLDVEDADGVPLHALHLIDFSEMPLSREEILDQVRAYFSGL